MSLENTACQEMEFSHISASTDNCLWVVLHCEKYDLKSVSICTGGGKNRATHSFAYEFVETKNSKIENKED